MLLNNFFFIENNAHQDHKINTQIRVNEQHEIFKGHFPQQAVLPGVCMIEMIKEILQFNFERKYLLRSSSMIKFLTVFSPDNQTQAEYEIEYKTSEQQEIIISAMLKHNENIFLKFKGTLTEK